MNALKELAEAFDNLAKSSPPMTIRALADACDPLVSMINLVDTFSTEAWREEITAKVETLRSASNNQMNTLEKLIKRDVRNHRVRSPNSNSRVLVLLRRSIEALKVLAEELLTGRDVTLQAAADKAYRDVFHRHHDSTTRFTANQVIALFPCRQAVMDRLGETTANEVDYLLRMYVDASAVVINYIDEIFLNNTGHGTDW